MTKTWSIEQAAHNLRVAIIPFNPTPWNGVPREADGYSNTHPLGGSAMALREDAPYQKAVAMHELAHIVMGHTNPHQSPAHYEAHKDLYEVQAELVAIIVANWAGLEGEDANQEHMKEYVVGYGLSLGRAPSESEVEAVREAAALIYAAGTLDLSQESE